MLTIVLTFLILIATFHAGSENKCDPSDPDALRTLFAVFGYVPPQHHQESFG